MVSIAMQENIPEPGFEKIPESLKPNFKFNRKTIISLLVFIVLLIAIPVSIYLVKQTQILKSRADEIKVVSSKPAWQTYVEMSSKNEIKPPEEILEIQLNYDKNSNPQISLGKIQRKNGYATQYDQKEGKYMLVLYDNQDKEVSSLKFDISNVVKGVPSLLGESDYREKYLEMDKFSTIITISWKEAVKLAVIDTTNNILATASLVNIPKIENTPNFNSIYGDDLSQNRETNHKKINSSSGSKINYAGGSNGYLDILFIGDKYAGDSNKFRNDIENYSRMFLTFQPFKARASQIRFYYIDNTEDLACYFIGRSPICNLGKAIEIANSAEVPYDRIYVLINSDVYAGGAWGDPTRIALGTNIPGGEYVFVHELGHTVGKLEDEYIADYSVDLSNRIDRNCYSGTPPDPAWEAYVSQADYYQGCATAFWYRSSEESIMKGWVRLSFNPASRVLINQELDLFAGPFDGEVPINDPVHSCFECKGSRPGVNAPAYYVESWENDCRNVCFNNLGNACVYQHPATPSCQTKEAASAAQKVKDDAEFSGASFDMQCGRVSIGNCLMSTFGTAPVISPTISDSKLK